MACPKWEGKPMTLHAVSFLYPSSINVPCSSDAVYDLWTIQDSIQSCHGGKIREESFEIAFGKNMTCVDEPPSPVNRHHHGVQVGSWNRAF